MSNPSLIQRRVGDLKAYLLEHAEPGDPAELWVAIYCDECFTVVQLPTHIPEAWGRMLAGWRLGEDRPYRDLCPDCR